MPLLGFLFIGLIAGWLAGLIMRGSGFGIFGDLFVGVLGSFLGRWIFGMLNLPIGGFIGSILCATAGAIVLVVLVRLVKRA